MQSTDMPDCKRMQKCCSSSMSSSAACCHDLRQASQGTTPNDMFAHSYTATSIAAGTSVHILLLAHAQLVVC
jgi:hypothetical protein